MADYYELLGLEPSCTQKDIRRAFREKAKLFHPDLTGGDSGKTETMRSLLAAYEALSSPRRRREYDARFRSVFSHYVFDYREFLKERPDEPEMQAKLILFDLLHGEEVEAIEVFTARFARDGLRLKKLLDREDFMDGGFLLAEALEEAGQYMDAFRLLVEISAMEKQNSYFRHFFVEVMGKLKKILREDLPRSVSGELLVSALEEMIALDFSRRENAKYWKRIAEIHGRSGDSDRAARALRKALECDRYLTGLAALKKKIGYVD